MDNQASKQGDTEVNQEVTSLRKRICELEAQLGDAQKIIQKHLLEANEVDLLKIRSTDTLTKAKSVIFENTKMIKNQELQIEAMNKQVESLRDVVKITKDLLEIRNLEVDQLETKIHCMEEKYKAEKERQDLMHQKLEQMIRHNGELKREYEAQLCLFQALRDRYDERELAKGVVETLKADIKVDKEKEAKQKIEESKVEQTVTVADQTDTKPEQNVTEPNSILEKEPSTNQDEVINNEVEQNSSVNVNPPIEEPVVANIGIPDSNSVNPNTSNDKECIQKTV